MPRVVGCYSRTALASNRAHDADKYNCADKCHYKTIDVESGDTGLAKKTHNPAAKNSTDDTDDDVHERALLSVCAHDFGCDPTNKGAEDDPQNNTHSYCYY